MIHFHVYFRKCGSTAPPVVTSTDNVMTVQFVSDESIAHEGFSSSYVALNASTCKYNGIFVVDLA